MTIAFLFFGAVGQTVQEPDLLRLAREGRTHFKTAFIEYTMECVFDDFEPRRYVSRFAGDSHFYVKKGLPDGRELRDAEAAVGQPFAFAEQRGLIEQDNTSWHYVEGGCTATRRSGSESPALGTYDARTLGLSIDPKIGETPADCFPLDKIDYFEEYEEPGLARVRAFSSKGPEMTWELNPAYGYQPTRITVGYDGRESRQTTVEYDVFDGHWFPVEILYYNSSGEVWMRFKLLKAEFDRPSHPQSLDPTFLQMPVGTQIGAPPPGPGPLVWDGTELVGFEEAYQRFKAGALDISEWDSLRRLQASGACVGCYPKSMEGEWFGLFGAPRKPKLWEEYVRRFIQVFALDKEQSGKAWDSHKHWYEKAKPRLDAMESTLKEIDKKLADLRDPNKTPLKDADPAKETANLEERKNKLLKPIEAMFQEGLRPDLFKLPTQEQKAVVLKREEDKKGSSGLIELLRKP